VQNRRGWPKDEFIALGLLPGQKKRAERHALSVVEGSLCPGNGACVGARVALLLPALSLSKGCPILRTGKSIVSRTRCRAVFDCQSSVLTVNLKKSQWTFQSRKSGHFEPRFCGLLIPRLTGHPTPSQHSAWLPSSAQGKRTVMGFPVPGVPCSVTLGWCFTPVSVRGVTMHRCTAWPEHSPFWACLSTDLARSA